MSTTSTSYLSNRSFIYSRQELSLFKKWHQNQKRYNNFMRLFKNIYKPWHDKSIIYKDRYISFMKNYKRYQITKKQISKKINNLLFHSQDRNYDDNYIRTIIYDTLNKYGFYQNNEYKTIEMTTCKPYESNKTNVAHDIAADVIDNVVADVTDNIVADDVTDDVVADDVTDDIVADDVTDDVVADDVTDDSSDSSDESDDSDGEIHFTNAKVGYSSDLESQYNSGYESYESGDDDIDV
jgi:hypothetical protein